VAHLVRTLPTLPRSDGDWSAGSIASAVGGGAKNADGVLGAVKASKRTRIDLISGRPFSGTSPNVPIVRPRQPDRREEAVAAVSLDSLARWRAVELSAV